MNVLGIVKLAAEVVVSVGVGAVVGNAIKASTPANAQILQKIGIGIGSLVLSNMVGDMAAKYTTKMIDDSAEEIKKLKNATQIVIQDES